MTRSSDDRGQQRPVIEREETAQMQDRTNEMAARRDVHSVQFAKDLYREILKTVKESTGVTPNVPEFVEEAIKMRLDFYRSHTLQSAESNLARTGTEG